MPYARVPQAQKLSEQLNSVYRGALQHHIAWGHVQSSRRERCAAAERLAPRCATEFAEKHRLHTLEVIFI